MTYEELEQAESTHWEWLELLAKIDRQLARERADREWSDEGWNAL